MSSDSMLAAIVCFMSARILAMRLSSTNMLCSGAFLFPSLSKTPLWMWSGVAATNFVVDVGGSEKCLASAVRARAMGSKLAGLVLLPKVWPVGINRSSPMTKEIAAAMSGLCFAWRKAPDTSSSKTRMSSLG
eukprot:scaffold15529_cov49-Attheya_sp.AAC.2